jgi:hypothetical protein
MRSDTEINAEIAALRKALALPGRWNQHSRNLITQTIVVLEKRMSAAQVEHDYYVDETMEDFREGDNDLYNALVLVSYWLAEVEGHDKAPSDTL